MRFYVSSKFFNYPPFSPLSSHVHYFSAILADLAFNTITRFIEASALGINSMSIYRQLIDRDSVVEVIRGWTISSNWRIETERERISPPGLHPRDPLWSLSRSDPSTRRGNFRVRAPSSKYQLNDNRIYYSFGRLPSRTARPQFYKVIFQRIPRAACIVYETDRGVWGG